MPSAFNAQRLLAPGQAVVAFLSAVALRPPGTECVTIDAAFDRILSADVVARADHPPYARSTMDGFALRSADGTHPRTLCGAVRMGYAPPHGLGALQAMRIPTGGVVPEGADAVVPQEDVRETASSIIPNDASAAGDYMTPAASDVRRGECVLTAGRRLGAAEMGVLAALGSAEVPVYLRPRIALITTGDELIEPDREPQIGQVRDSNRFAIGGSLRAMGCDVVAIGPVADDSAELRAALKRAVKDYDGVILSGGSSVGERDLVPRIVAELGDPGVIVHGLRVKPGKPTMLAAIGNIPVIGLPGNPTSALMMLEAVGRPAIAACTGEIRSFAPARNAIARAPFAGRDGWTWYMPVQLERSGETLYASPLHLHSAHVSLLARAHGYAIVGERRSRIETGEPLEVFSFGAGGPPVLHAP